MRRYRGVEWPLAGGEPRKDINAASENAFVHLLQVKC